MKYKNLVITGSKIKYSVMLSDDTNVSLPSKKEDNQTPEQKKLYPLKKPGSHSLAALRNFKSFNRL